MYVPFVFWYVAWFNTQVQHFTSPFSHMCISEYIGALMKKYNKWLYGWFCMTKSTTNICKRESIKEKKKHSDANFILHLNNHCCMH